jgi:hypothetical protein
MGNIVVRILLKQIIKRHVQMRAQYDGFMCAPTYLGAGLAQAV